MDIPGEQWVQQGLVVEADMPHMQGLVVEEDMPDMQQGVQGRLGKHPPLSPSSCSAL